MGVRMPVESWMEFLKIGVDLGLGIDVEKAMGGCQGMRARGLAVPTSS